MDGIEVIEELKNLQFSERDVQQDKCIDLQKKIENIRNYQKELSIAIDYEKRKGTDLADDNVTELFENIAKTQAELGEEIKREAIANITVPGLQQADALFRYTIDVNGGPEIDEDFQQELQSLLTHTSKVSGKINEEHQRITKLDSEISKIQLEVARIASEKRNLLKKIQAKEERLRRSKETLAASETAKKLQTKIDRATKIININNQLLPLLIGRSGLRWTKDPDLLPILLECGQKLKKQIEIMRDDTME